MRPEPTFSFRWCLPVVALSLLCAGSGPVVAEDEKITYQDHVLPIFESRCFSCHNPDRRRGGLDLSTYANTLEGGSGGTVAEAGDASASRVFTTVSHQEEPVMPPEGGRIPDAEIEILRKWVEGGLLETSASVARRPRRPQLDLSMDVPSGRPEGPPPMPEHTLLEPVVVTQRGDAVTSLAASPWAPLVAVGGQHQVLLYDTKRARLAAVLPYPEGFVESLRFSRSGTLLIAGAGRAGRMGHAVAWDIRTGNRLMELGREFDSAMTADITPDHQLAALGSTARRVRVFRTGDGEMEYEIDDHTEWVVAVAFSPDGILLASGDRNGNVFVYEAATGAQFHVIGNVHEGGVTDLAWRPDSNVLASAGENGRVRLWAMQNGREIHNIEAHAGGVTSVDFSHEGQVVSAGRDGTVKIWKPDGNLHMQVLDSPDLVTSVRFLEDSNHVVVGDFTGQLQLWSVAGEEPALLTDLSSHPAPIETRRELEIAAMSEWQEESAKREQALVLAKSEAETLQQEMQAARVAAGQHDELSKERTRALEAARKTRETALAEQEKLQLKRAELEQANEMFIKAQQTVTALDQELAGETERLNRLRGELAQLTAAEEEESSQETRTEGEGAPEAMAELERQLAAAEVAVNTLQQRRTAAAAEVREPEPLAPVLEELEKLKQQVPGLDTTIAESTAGIAEAEQKRDNANQQAEGVQEKLTAHETQVQEIAAAAAAAREQMQMHEREAKWLEAARFNVGLLSERNQLRELEADLEGMGLAAGETQARITAGAEAIQQHEHQKTVVVPGLMTETKQAEDLVKAGEKNIEDLRARHESIKRMIGQLGEQHAAGQQGLKLLQEELNGVESLLGEAGAADEAAANPAGQALAALRAQVVAVEQALEGTEKQLAELQPKESLEQIEQAELARLDTLKEQHRVKMAAVEEKRAEIAAAEQKLVEVQAAMEKDRQELAVIETEQAELERQAAEIRQLVAQQEQEYLAMLPQEAPTDAGAGE